MHPLMWVFLAGLVLSAGLHAYAAARTHSGTRTNMRRSPIGVSTASIPHPIFGAPTVLPDGHEISSCTPEDIQAVYHANTIDQFNRLLGGKWFKMSGKINQNHGKGLIFLEQHSPLIVLQFGKGWDEQLSLLPRGSDVTFRGKLMASNLGAIELHECEVL